MGTPWLSTPFVRLRYKNPGIWSPSDPRLPKDVLGRGEGRLSPGFEFLWIPSPTKYCEAVILLLCRDSDTNYEFFFFFFWIATIIFWSSWMMDRNLSVRRIWGWSLGTFDVYRRRKECRCLHPPDEREKIHLLLTIT